MMPTRIQHSRGRHLFVDGQSTGWLMYLDTACETVHSNAPSRSPDSIRDLSSTLRRRAIICIPVAMLSAIALGILWVVHSSRETHFVYAYEVLHVAPAVHLDQEPGRPELEQRSAHGKEATGLPVTTLAIDGFDHDAWVIPTPSGSTAFRLPRISSNNSVKVRARAPLWSYFANTSSNCYGQERPPVWYVSLPGPDYICCRNDFSPGPMRFRLVLPQRGPQERGGFCVVATRVPSP